MKEAENRLASIIAEHNGKLVLDKTINFYGESISGKITRIEKKDDEFYALVEATEGFLFSESIPKNKITNNFVDKVKEHIKN